MSQVFDRTGHGFLEDLFLANAFTARRVKATEDRPDVDGME